MSSWRCVIDDKRDTLNRFLRFAIIRDAGEGMYDVIQPDGSYRRVGPIRDNEIPADDVVSWFVLPTETAAAVFAAFSRYAGGPEIPSALRRDYDKERERVDRLTGALIATLEKATQPPMIVDYKGGGS